METRVLGRTGMQVSVLGFGGAEIGYENASQDAVYRLLGGALDAGLNVIDTAECYNESETLIGNAIRQRRADLFLFSKCGHAAGLDFPDWSQDLLRASIDRSLKRLQTDRLDLIQLHGCSEQLLRSGEVVEVLQKARAAGKTRFIGYSGDSAAARYAVECGAFDTLQTSIRIADQEAIELTLPLAVQHNIGVIAKRPIANAAWQTGSSPDSYGHIYWSRLNRLDYDCLRAGTVESFPTALRFTLSTPGVCTAIVGTSKPGRWQENAQHVAAGLLPQDQYDRIRARWKETAGADWTGQG
ncbi:MAG TPA: aldo/keto reductase [Chthonomonadales bacterium]|nr:aldo/keto reductase [Chthonomonadales bacterium]